MRLEAGMQRLLKGTMAAVGVAFQIDNYSYGE